MHLVWSLTLINLRNLINYPEPEFLLIKLKWQCRQSVKGSFSLYDRNHELVKYSSPGGPDTTGWCQLMPDAISGLCWVQICTAASLCHLILAVEEATG